MSVFEVSDVKAAAQGRWREILFAAGCPVEVLDGRQHPCPRCGGTDRFRAFDDFERRGAVRCNQCFAERCGDGIAAVGWLLDMTFPAALEFIGEQLGLERRGSGRRPAQSMVEMIATMKRVQADVLREFGATDAERDGQPVCRVPVFGPDGGRCGSFDIGTVKALSKGKLGRGQRHGLFLRDGKLPQSGASVVVVEGVKDAAALVGINFEAVGLPTCQLAGKFARVFRGIHVTIVPDRDVAGETGARKTAAVLYHVAASIRIATLPGAVKTRDGDDVRDVLARQDGEQLVRDAVESALEWEPDLTTLDGSQPTPIENSVIVDDGDGGKVVEPKSMADILREIVSATGGWPRRVGSALFVDNDAEVSWLERSAAFLGWLGNQTGRPAVFRRSPGLHTAPEVFEELKRTATGYEDVETFPHEPPVPGVYYACPTIRVGDGSTLRTLVERFTPATSIDGDLILAMFATAFWGGTGSRPVFAITSDDGRGAGKTTLASMVARLCGGFVDIKADEPVERAKQRLLSAEGMTKRVAIVDNVKSRKFSSAGLEALVTAPAISGHRMYVGEAHRPNNLLWIVTLNGVSFATDMAVRSVMVKIRRPSHSGSWQDETEAFIDANRALVADCIGLLRSEASELEQFSRWARWERGVLARLPKPPKAQAIVVERQREADAESDEADDLEDFIAGELRAMKFDPDRDRVFIPSKVLADWTNAVTAERNGLTAVSRMVRQGIREGRLERLTENRHRGWGRGFVWIGDEADTDAPVRTDLDARLEGRAG